MTTPPMNPHTSLGGEGHFPATFHVGLDHVSLRVEVSSRYLYLATAAELRVNGEVVAYHGGWGDEARTRGWYVSRDGVVRGVTLDLRNGAGGVWAVLWIDGRRVMSGQVVVEQGAEARVGSCAAVGYVAVVPSALAWLWYFW